MHNRELIEAEAIHKESALQTIAALIRRYAITEAELVETSRAADNDDPKTIAFDPIFDVR